MYTFITDTYNVLKGSCEHDCAYCYMKRFGPQRPIRFDESELKTDLGKGKFIFVGSSTDMFAQGIFTDTITRILDYLKKFDNKYLLQTKNPARYLEFDFPDNFVLGTTIETNRIYSSIMGETPGPTIRAEAISKINNKKFITIEPVLDFDEEKFAELINKSGVSWVNIGADSGNNNLPEPPKKKIDALVKLISAKITIKKNMKRVI